MKRRLADKSLNHVLVRPAILCIGLLRGVL